MPRYPRTLAKLTRDKTGVTAVEYGLIAALIAMAIVTAANTLTTNFASMFAILARHLSINGI